MKSKLSLAVVAVALAFPLAAQSVEGTAYLAPRDRTAASEAVFEEAPPDTGMPVKWRGGVPGADPAEGHESFPLYGRARWGAGASLLAEAQIRESSGQGS